MLHAYIGDITRYCFFSSLFPLYFLFFFFFSNCDRTWNSVVYSTACLLLLSLDDMEGGTSVAIRDIYFLRHHLSISSSRSNWAMELHRSFNKLQISPMWAIIKTFYDLDSSQTEVVWILRLKLWRYSRKVRWEATNSSWQIAGFF